VEFALGPKYYVESSHNYFVQFYLATVNYSVEQFKIQKEEVEQLKWLAKQDLFNDFRKNPASYVPAMKYYVGLFQ
jgi:isopentenyldiphosphate isomerase